MDASKILSTVDSVLSALKAIANTPGINLIPYVNVAAAAISALQAAFSAGRNIQPYIDAILNTFKKDYVPTQAELDALDAKITSLEAQVQAPLPPPDEGEPD